MLKKSLVIFSLCSVFSPLAHAFDTYNISGDGDRPIPKAQARYKLIRCDGKKKLKVLLDSGDKDRAIIKENLFISLVDPLYQYGYKGTVFSRNLKVQKSALVKLGFSDIKEEPLNVSRQRLGLLSLPYLQESKEPTETMSSATLRHQLLEMPLRDLLTSDSQISLYDTLLMGRNSDNFLTQKNRITMEQLRRQLPDHLPFKNFLIDPRDLFTESDPDANTVSITEGMINIQAQMMRSPYGTCTFKLKVSPTDSDLISFSIDPLLVQEETITRLITSEEASAEEKSLLQAALQQSRMNDVLGTMGFKHLIGVLSSQPFRKKAGSEIIDYSDFSGDLTVLRFSQLLAAKLGTAQLVTWAVTQ